MFSEFFEVFKFWKSKRFYLKIDLEECVRGRRFISFSMDPDPIYSQNAVERSARLEKLSSVLGRAWAGSYRKAISGSEIGRPTIQFPMLT